MALNFNQHATKGYEFLKKVTSAMGVEYDEDIAGRVTRAVFHTLRDQLTPEENLQLISQLPIALKGVYVDGWKIGPKDRIRHKEQFIELVRARLGNTDAYDIGSNETAWQRIKAVFEAMHEYVSEGEMNDVYNQLPRDLKEMLLINPQEHY